MGRLAALLADPVLRDWLAVGYRIIPTGAERPGVIVLPGVGAYLAIPDGYAPDCRADALDAAICRRLREHLGEEAFRRLLLDLAAMAADTECAAD